MMNLNCTKSNGKWAIMLCGGMGSRMGSLTKSTPKSLLEVHGKPIIWYAFWNLYRKGFRHFILPLGFLGNMIKDYLVQISRNLDCDIYFVETGEDTSIADRIRRVCHLIPSDEHFFLLNTDTIFDFDINAMYSHHIKSDALVTLSSVEVISPWGILTVANEKVVGFDRNRKVQRLISSQSKDSFGVVNSGLAWIKKSALDLLDFYRIGDFETDLFNAAILEGRVAHVKLEGVWVPIDTPKDLAAINYTLDTDENNNSSIKNLLFQFQNIDNLKTTPDY